MKKTLLCILAVLLLCGSLSGCKSGGGSCTASFFLMDTTVTVTLYTNDDRYAEEIFSECRFMLTELDVLWSRTNGASDTARFNAAEQSLTLDERTAMLLQTALSVSKSTNGAFDITVAPLVTLWETCEVRNSLPTDAELQAALESVGSFRLTLDGNTLTKTNASTQIDLGGIGKGGAVELLLYYLSGCDVKGGLVSFGSNVAVFGQKPDGKAYRIALRDPADAAGTVGVLTLADGEILSVSGDYERYITVEGERYHHLIDPKTGYPTENELASVAVITNNGALADALSTALYVMGYTRAMELYASDTYAFEAIFITHSGEIYATDGANFEKNQ